LLNAELDRLRAIGIEILLETPVGRGITLEELRKATRRFSSRSALTWNGDSGFQEKICRVSQVAWSSYGE
jgi:hypothetical protein